MEAIGDHLEGRSCDIPRLKKCFFVVPLTLGVQLFGYVSILSSLAVLYALADIAMHEYNCAENRYTCTLMSVDIFIKCIQIGLSFEMLLSVYMGRHHYWALHWAWYTLACSLFTVLFFRAGLQSVEHEPGWTYLLSFVWDVYGSLVAYSYFKSHMDDIDGL